jgi:hypothetical protein
LQLGIPAAIAPASSPDLDHLDRTAVLASELHVLGKELVVLAEEFQGFELVVELDGTAPAPLSRTLGYAGDYARVLIG